MGQMISINPSEKESYTLDSDLIKHLDKVKNLLREQWMVLFIIVSRGKPGSGKSTLAAQMCKYVDPLFDLDQCVFTGQDLKETCERIGQERHRFAIQFDEAKTIFNKKRQLSDHYIELDNYMEAVRKVSPFICFCTPNLFDLPKTYISKCEAVINVIWKDDTKNNTRKRGYFDIFGDQKSLKLYKKGRDWEDYNAVIPDFESLGFNKYVPFDWNTYQAKKDKARKDLDMIKKTYSARADKTSRIVFWLCDQKGFKPKELSQVSGYSLKHIYNLIERGKKIEIET